MEEQSIGWPLDADFRSFPQAQSGSLLAGWREENQPKENLN